MKKGIQRNGPWYWVRDASGEKSVSVTLVFFGFWITAATYTLSCVERIGPVMFRQFDSTACSTFLIPILTLYFGRRLTDAKLTATAQKQDQSTQ